MSQYYKAGDLLVQYYPEKKKGYVRNVTNEKRLLTDEELFALSPSKMNKSKFNEELNIFFKNVKHKWTFQATHYRKLDNFEVSNFGALLNYDYNKLPRHVVPELSYLDNRLIVVYNQGRIYYFTWSYNGYAQGQLYDVKTFKFAKWARPQNCAPVFDEDNCKMV